MLVLTRKAQQSIQIGDNIKISVVRVRGNTIQLGIEAPKQIRVMRTELLEKDEETGTEGKDAGDSESSLPESHGHAGHPPNTGIAGTRGVNPSDLKTAV